MRKTFNVGDRVVVLPYSSYNGKFENELGIIDTVFYRSTTHATYGVKLDNHNNPVSAKGLFWFEASGIELDNEREEITMFDNFIVAEVEFLDNQSRRYAYALYDPKIKKDDFVVVCTVHHGFALAKVTDIFEDEESKNKVMGNREIVCKVDFSEYNARKETEKRVIELKRDMEKHIREAQEIALYEVLAEKDPTLKGMLDEYKNLLGYCK